MADKNAYLYHTFKAGDKGIIGGWKVDILNKEILGTKLATDLRGINGRKKLHYFK